VSVVNAALPGRQALRNGLPGWKPYVYRGIGIDILTPHLTTDELFAPAAEVCWCGESQYGYRLHRKRGEEPCQASREANTTAEAARRERRKHGIPRHLEPCGTEAAYRRHIRRGEPIDDACRQANALKLADWKEGAS